MNIIKCLRHLELSAGTMPTMGLPPVSASENRQRGGVVVGVGWQGDGGGGGVASASGSWPVTGVSVSPSVVESLVCFFVSLPCAVRPDGWFHK